MKTFQTTEEIIVNKSDYSSYNHPLPDPELDKIVDKLNKTRPDCKKCEHEHNNYTGTNDNNWHWKTIGQGEGIQKVKMSRLGSKMIRLEWLIVLISGLICISCWFAWAKTAQDIKAWQNNLPAVVPAIETKVCEVKKGIFTAYSPEERQTDSDPNINASGHRVQLGDIACPAIYSFGTKIEVLGKVYVCRDRMAERYRNSTDPLYFDIFMFDENSAKMWGRQELNYTIVK